MSYVVLCFIPVLMLVSYPFHSDVDDAIIRPLPRAKRTLSEPNILPHMVQLLLTFDPRLVEKVVTLLNKIMEVGSHNKGKEGRRGMEGGKEGRRGMGGENVKEEERGLGRK